MSDKVIPRTLGKRLQEARLALGYRQEYVEEKLGIPQNIISRLELDLTKKPKIEHLEKLANFYGITVEYLITNPYTIDHIPWEIQLMLYDKQALPYIAEAFVKYQADKYKLK